MMMSPDEMMMKPGEMMMNPDEMMMNPDEMMMSPDDMMMSPDEMCPMCKEMMGGIQHNHDQQKESSKDEHINHVCISLMIPHGDIYTYYEHNEHFCNVWNGCTII